jgi:hypothetical protein
MTEYFGKMGISSISSVTGRLWIGRKRAGRCPTAGGRAPPWQILAVALSHLSRRGVARLSLSSAVCHRTDFSYHDALQLPVKSRGRTHPYSPLRTTKPYFPKPSRLGALPRSQPSAKISKDGDASRKKETGRVTLVSQRGRPLRSTITTVQRQVGGDWFRETPSVRRQSALMFEGRQARPRMRIVRRPLPASAQEVAFVRVAPYARIVPCILACCPSPPGATWKGGENLQQHEEML